MRGGNATLKPEYAPRVLCPLICMATRSGTAARTELSLGVPEQLNQRGARSPIIRRMSHRGRVEIEETHQDFADNARANRPESIATAPNVSLPLDVVPERCLAAPANSRCAD